MAIMQQHRLGCGHRGSVATKSAASRRSVTVLAVASGSAPRDEAAVHNGRLPFLKTLQQFVSPQKYAAEVLAGNTFAWGKIGVPAAKDTLFIADLPAARSIMASELQLGVGGDWPDTLQDMMGRSSISMTTDLDMHARLRQYLGMAFTKESVQQALPDLQATAALHLERWAAATASNSTSSASDSSSSSPGSAQQPATGLATTPDGSMVIGYPAVRALTFDVLVNRVLGLAMSDEEVQQYEELFQVLVGGFVPPAWDVPFTPYGKGLRARKQLSARIMETLNSPQCSGPLARLRDEFGADSPVAIDNTITMLFAGFDTTSSSLTYLLWALARHPEVMAQVQEEQAAVVAAHGPTLTPEAYAAMPYTMAAIREALRLAQIVGFVPRLATRELPVPGGPTLPAGCPFIVALAAISAADPAVQAAGDVEQCRPERWLDPVAAKSLAQHQLPFGTGQRTCVGMNLALAEMAAVLAELARHYSLTADWQTEWKDFPIKRPANDLPLRLTRRATAAAAAGQPAQAAVAVAAV